MNLALRLAVACFVVAAPTLLYLGLLRGLRSLRDDALLTSLAERNDAPEDVSRMADRALEKQPTRADGSGRTGTDERSADERGAHSSALAAPRSETTAAPRSETAAPRPDTVICGDCGASNMLGARYCGECLDELDW